MPTPETAFEPPVGQDVGFANHSRKAHGILERDGEQRGAETNPRSALRRRGEHGQRVCGDGESWKEMVVNDRVDVESYLVGVLDLPENLPGQLGVGFFRRRLHLCVDSEPH